MSDENTRKEEIAVFFPHKSGKKCLEGFYVHPHQKSIFFLLAQVIYDDVLSKLGMLRVITRPEIDPTRSK